MERCAILILRRYIQRTKLAAHCSICCSAAVLLILHGVIGFENLYFERHSTSESRLLESVDLIPRFPTLDADLRPSMLSLPDLILSSGSHSHDGNVPSSARVPAAAWYMSHTVVDGVQVQNLGKRAGPVDTRQEDRRSSCFFSLLATPRVLFTCSFLSDRRSECAFDE